MDEPEIVDEVIRNNRRNLRPRPYQVPLVQQCRTPTNKTIFNVDFLVDHRPDPEDITENEYRVRWEDMWLKSKDILGPQLISQYFRRMQNQQPPPPSTQQQPPPPPSTQQQPPPPPSTQQQQPPPPSTQQQPPPPPSTQQPPSPPPPSTQQQPPPPPSTQQQPPPSQQQQPPPQQKGKKVGDKIRYSGAARRRYAKNKNSQNL